jgi:hypothetical protein
MKRLLATCMLIFCLSFPVFGGHAQTGGKWCECNNPEVCMMGLTFTDETETQQDQTPSKEVSELDLFIDVLLMLIRF